MTPRTTEGSARAAGGGEKRPPRGGGSGAARARGPGKAGVTCWACAGVRTNRVAGGSEGKTQHD